MWQSRLFYLLGCWILMVSTTQLVPFFTAVILGETRVVSGFLASMMVCLLIGGSLFLGFRSSSRIKVTRLTILLPILGGMSLGFVVGLPFFFIFPEQGLTAAFFEGISLITTTGVSAYEGAFTNMDAIVVWRALSSWLGGLLAICLALSILTALNSGGIQLHRSSLPFGDSETGYPRLRAVAVAIAPIYILVTATCCIALMLLGHSTFNAILFAFAAVSTSGISPTGGSVVLGVPTQVILAISMVIAMLNWDILRAKMLRQRIKHPYGTETRSVFFIIGGGTFILFLLVFPGDLEGLWLALFTAISALSTTGFSPENMVYGEGSAVSAAIIFALLACMGGAVAGTTGGLRQLRLITIYILGRREVDRLGHPHGVKSLTYQSFSVEKRDVDATWLLVGAFVLALIWGALSLAVMGINFQTAIAMSVSALTLSGPLISMIDPQFSGFPGLTDADYFILSILMLVGRVEASLFLVLFTRAFWRG